MAPKRPAGLGAASKAKKNKQEEPNKEERSNVVPSTQEDTEDGDDWLDLLELWEKCKTSLTSQYNYINIVHLSNSTIQVMSQHQAHPYLEEFYMKQVVWLT